MEIIYLQILQIAQIVVFLPKVLNAKEKQDFSAQKSIKILFCIIPHKKVKAFYPLPKDCVTLLGTADELKLPSWNLFLQ